MDAKSPQARFKPGFETLEARDMMAVTSATLIGGTLTITADDANDVIEVRRVDPLLRRTQPGATLQKGVTFFGPQIVVTDKTASPNAVHSFRAGDVSQIIVRLNGGNDSLDARVNKTLTVEGGDGNDIITTGDAADFIFGGGGNDLIKSGGGDDLVHGEAGNDVVFGGNGNDTIFGDAGFNTLRGEAHDDRIFAGSRSDIVDGGAGYDHLELLAKTVNPTRGGESIHIDVPTDQPQDDGWSCGPNSGSRLLRAYGINVSYSQLRGEVQEESLLATVHLGTRPSVLRHAIGQHRALTQLETASNRGRVLELLRAGKPVIALVATKKVSFGVGSIGLLHYVVLNGFDEASQRVNYVDTNGQEKSWSYSDFDYHWRWFDHFTWAGEAVQGMLEGIGLRKRTIIF